MDVRKRGFSIVLSTISISLFIGVGCGGGNQMTNPHAQLEMQTSIKSESESTDTTFAASNGVSQRPYSYNNGKNKESDSKISKNDTESLASIVEISHDSANSIDSKQSNKDESTDGSSAQSNHQKLLYHGNVISEDSSNAVDDYIWRQFDLAAEYHSMGVIANREASWEEAQYYFDKAFTIMAELDVEADSIFTPEAVKYTSILENLISDYRVTLRSLGELTDDATPAVILERYGNISSHLQGDTMQVFNRETNTITYDLPVKMNDRVKASIIYFQTVAKEAFYKYLSRKPRYEKLFRKILTEHGVPQDLIYLSLVESGYNPKAYSWARASGLWQFISSTGRMYGLKRDWWIDERRDPVKSTHAAARFLKDLNKKFGDWELAMAAYNGGPGRVSRTIKKQRTKDFWKMRLRRQTMDYIPLIYAAAIIAKNPLKYGFDNVQVEEEIRWDEVEIDRALELKVVARALNSSVSKLKEINPELLRNFTPPNRKKYNLKLPFGTKEMFLAAYPKMPSPKQSSWVKHKIRRGETVSSIANKYGVSQYSILSSNNLGRRARIIAGKTIIVPVPLDRKNNRYRKKNKNYAADNSIYAVRSGDTMWDIARAFGTSVDALRRINTIKRGSRIYVGQRLKIPSNARNFANLNSSSPRIASKSNSNSSSKKSKSAIAKTSTKSYKIRSGDSLWEIARRHGTTTSRLRRLNSLGRSSRIYPGQILVVEGTSGPRFFWHKVRRGETLSRIARKYRTTISRIQANNGLTNPDALRVGTKLKIYTGR